jgi:DnaJ-domain-containing protein 1
LLWTWVPDVDKFFDKLGDFVRSFTSEQREARPGARAAGGPADPDMREAWEELDAYLNGEERSRPQPERPADPETELLRQDYANLEVPFGAPFEQVKKSYRRLLAAYHPDRNTGDAERLRLATEITQKLNASYGRIEALEARRSR